MNSTQLGKYRGRWNYYGDTYRVNGIFGGGRRAAA